MNSPLIFLPLLFVYTKTIIIFAPTTLFKMQKGRPKGINNKVGIYLRLSANVVEWLKAYRGYNAIADMILSNYIRRHKEDALQEKLDRLNKKK